jgi:CRP-like cAMP-binding protein
MSREPGSTLTMRRPPAAPRDLARADAAAFAAAVRKIEPLGDADIAGGLASLGAHVRTLPRHTHLLRAGQRATQVAVVVSGLLREYFVLPDGSERTKAFVAENELSGSLADLLSGGPSRAFIVAEEPSRLLVASAADYTALAARSDAWARFQLRALERLLLAKAEREYELLGMDAAARYAALVARWPGLEARVAARHVASYLGITPVHLSRLRRRRREARRHGG